LFVQTNNNEKHKLVAIELAKFTALPIMNIFRLAGDMFHLFSFLVLFLKMHASRSVAGEVLDE
jgi:hypothetical protein